MSKTPIRLVIIALVLSALVIFTISAGGCPRKSKNTKTGSSANNTFMINAPSNLTATVVSMSQIDLSWQNNANNADGFEIERSINGITYTILTPYPSYEIRKRVGKIA